MPEVDQEGEREYQLYIGNSLIARLWAKDDKAAVELVEAREYHKRYPWGLVLIVTTNIASWADGDRE